MSNWVNDRVLLYKVHGRGNNKEGNHFLLIQGYTVIRTSILVDILV